MYGASSGHSHPLKGNALNVTYGGVTRITHVVVALLTWELGHLVICGCRRGVGAIVSMLNFLIRNASKDECRRVWQTITLLRGQREGLMLARVA